MKWGVQCALVNQAMEMNQAKERRSWCVRSRAQRPQHLEPTHCTGSLL